MPEMNGATLTLKDPATGQVVEYEIVRAGTMKEHRRMLTDMAADATDRNNLRLRAEAGEAQRDDLRANLEEVSELAEKLRARTVNAEKESGELRAENEILQSRADGMQEDLTKAVDAAAALKSQAGNADLRLAEMTRERNIAREELSTLMEQHEDLHLKATQHEHAAEALKAGMVDLSNQKDEALENLKAAQEFHKTYAAEVAARADARTERRAALAGKIEEHKGVLATVLPELLGAIDELHEG